MTAEAKTEPEKAVTIYVNGTPHEVEKELISYEDLVELAFGANAGGDGKQYSIQYFKGASDKPKGTLLEGQSVKVKNGMEFDVTETNRS